MSDLLKDGLLKLNFAEEDADRICPLMETYIKELRLFNSAYNLVNTDDHDEIVIRHILDSLCACKNIESLANDCVSKKGSVVIADIGSGGGLPGIPLAASLPQFNFVLVERMSKRCAFLENCVAILGLKNVTVKIVEAERVESESIDIAVFRAFRPLDKKMIKTLLNMLPSGGKLAAYKAKKDKIVEEMSAINYPDGSYEVFPLEVPFLTDTDKDARERNLVVVEK